jgi:hypothetical protein
VRLLAPFDNVLLSHSDRTRLMADEHWPRVCTKNGLVKGAVLVDGFVRGIWRTDNLGRPGGGAMELTVELFESLTAADREAVALEGARLLAFMCPEIGAGEVRFQA